MEKDREKRIAKNKELKEPQRHENESERKKRELTRKDITTEPDGHKLSSISDRRQRP